MCCAQHLSAFIGTTTACLDITMFLNRQSRTVQSGCVGLVPAAIPKVPALLWLCVLLPSCAVQGDGAVWGMCRIVQ